MKSLGIFFFLFATFSVSAQVKSKTYNSLLKTILSHSVPEISVSEIDTQKEVLFLDARSTEEFAVSRISGSQFIGYEDFKLESVSEIQKDKNIVVYCSIGYRSEKIAEKLIAAGYTNVHNLYGGIFEWKNQGKYVVDKDDMETENVHAYNRLWGIWLKKGNRVYD